MHKELVINSISGQRVNDCDLKVMARYNGLLSICWLAGSSLILGRIQWMIDVRLPTLLDNSGNALLAGLVIINF